MKKGLATKSLIFSLLVMSFVFVNPTQADFLSPEKKNQYNENINEIVAQANIDTQRSLDDIIATVIKAVMGVLGTIFLILMFLAGNNWMRANGNEEKVKKSQKQIASLSIGLVIVLAAYALSSWVSELLANVID
ncbi:MAG: hypothetical protein PHH52_00260 [Patescibacteria group bacterium]|jgi:hypothetical protein|nr:hypothetical protein [Patescibacteria group bacterium]MDD3777807.1 hypothetical protein [Patescibacteria group bacterium]MDD3939476.1 hypothetical protein [Patescibacteria group bacterium]MDD4443553.1 hypothetical protein [Patescibacteria group bacterium]